MSSTLLDLELFFRKIFCRDSFTRRINELTYSDYPQTVSAGIILFEILPRKLSGWREKQVSNWLRRNQSRIHPAILELLTPLPLRGASRGKAPTDESDS